jgi:cytoplasmic iron level regulating protein YaaA (DUF328/UPF0246 family)
MIIVISPSKTLDFEPGSLTEYSQPRQLEQSQALIDTVKLLSPKGLRQLMGISDKLSQLNWQRYQDFQQPFDLHNAKQALLAFKGDVYNGIDVAHYTTEDFSFAQQHLRILSGLYGALKPLDLIQPYRLEMGTRLTNNRGKDLYQFWDTQVTEMLNRDFGNSDDPVLINLASNEYFKVIKPASLKAKVLTVSFKENKNGQYKVIGIYAKRARGLMTNFIIKHKITAPEAIKQFYIENYSYNSTLSTTQNWVFSRG